MTEIINHREYRRNLKQKLFTIRRFVEGEDVVLTEELETIKAQYEALPNFTSWSYFPEKWDIGDPYGVKAGYINSNDSAMNDIDRRNYQHLQGKEYLEIVSLEQNAGVNVGEESRNKVIN